MTRLLALLLLCISLAASAQPYPSKPIRVVVPFPAGGIADLYGSWTPVVKASGARVD